MTSARSFKLLWFLVDGVSLTASAHHFHQIRPRHALPASVRVHEVSAVLGLGEGSPSAQVGSVMDPDTGDVIWLGLGHHPTLITCVSDNLLVFPPWLRRGWSRTLLPACFAALTPHHDSLTWILDIAHLTRACADSTDAA